MDSDRGADQGYMPEECPPTTILDRLQLLALPEPRWLIADFIPANALVGFYGPPASYKSFIALDIAWSVATGVDFAGREVEPGGAIYVSGEGTAGTPDRMRAWESRRGGIGDGFGLFDGPVHFDEPTAVERFIADVAAFACRKGTIRLVVVDTLARCFLGDENSSRDMGRFIAGLDTVRHAFEATILVVHHTTKKGGSPRGSSALTGALDTQIEVVRRGSGRRVTLKCGKQKFWTEFDDVSLVGETIAVDRHEERPELGETMTWFDTTLVFEPVDRDADGSGAGGKLPGASRRILEVLAAEPGVRRTRRWIEAQTGLAKPTAYGNLGKLVQAGLVMQDTSQRTHLFWVEAKEEEKAGQEAAS
jgi:hypothetical protein